MSPSYYEKIDRFIPALEAAMKTLCAAEGLDYKDVKNSLSLQWAIDAAKASKEATKLRDAPFAAILLKALAAKREGDEAAYIAACLEWLYKKHGVALGDFVTLGGWAKPRTILLEKFYINVNEDDPVGSSFLWFEGDCHSHTLKNRSRHHGQGSMDYVRKEANYRGRR